MLLSYVPAYLSDELAYGTGHGLLILLIVMVLQMCVINRVGRLSHRFGRTPPLMTGCSAFSSSPGRGPSAAAPGG
ncbi:hypothetical protein AV521_43320 [Streptomyces sp. IMTB 2501]|nr:hypothetical protein AV521_43320 [Streptomyces sp. IMTB 2501]